MSSSRISSSLRPSALPSAEHRVILITAGFAANVPKHTVLLDDLAEQHREKIKVV